MQEKIATDSLKQAIGKFELRANLERNCGVGQGCQKFCHQVNVSGEIIAQYTPDFEFLPAGLLEKYKKSLISWRKILSHTC